MKYVKLAIAFAGGAFALFALGVTIWRWWCGHGHEAVVFLWAVLFGVSIAIGGTYFGLRTPPPEPMPIAPPTPRGPPTTLKQDIGILLGLILIPLLGVGPFLLCVWNLSDVWNPHVSISPFLMDIPFARVGQSVGQGYLFSLLIGLVVLAGGISALGFTFWRVKHGLANGPDDFEGPLLFVELATVVGGVVVLIRCVWVAAFVGPVQLAPDHLMQKKGIKVEQRSERGDVVAIKVGTLTAGVNLDGISAIPSIRKVTIERGNSAEVETSLGHLAKLPNLEELVIRNVQWDRRLIGVICQMKQLHTLDLDTALMIGGPESDELAELEKSLPRTKVVLRRN